MSRYRQDYYGHAHDERVEPHQDLEGHLPDPDWNNVLIHPEQKKMPVGDPTLWGNTVTTLIDDDPIQGNTPRVIFTDQFILAQSSDAYSRSWSLTGTLAVKGIGWRLLTGNAPSGDDITDEGMNAFISVTLGLGKITLEQQINLACNGAPSNIGLCWNQSSINGGPYVPTYSPLPNSADSYIILPFAAIGALVANYIAIRGVYCRGLSASGVVIPSAILTCMVTPYAPGHGI